MIYVYNAKLEDHTSSPNNFPIYRGTPLGNPFTHNGKRSSLAKFSFKTREEALDAFEEYFHRTYGGDNELTRYFDCIYERYKAGEDIYLQCFCKPLRCHGDFIAKMLQTKLIKEKLMKRKSTIKA